jgi:hypothetical protein|tara:strand:- start:279 stop:2192 length:1914 start_codon:yes stop_codon:yes gene_type:complete
MNIVEVQDNLKNFSQDQLINEINQPSGMVPQFLVLTELGRRNRIKQDMEGRQAQNQPTVAQEVVSAAGVPQGGIMDMARSMAPKSSIEQNDAVNMMKEGGKPRNRMDMLLAYLRSLGADEEEEVKEATGGKSIAEIINFGGDFRPVKKKADGGVVKMFTGGIGGLSTNANDFGGLTVPLLEGALSQSDLEKQRLAEEEAKRKKELERFLEKQKPKYKGGALPGGSQTDTFGLLGAEKKVVNGEEFYVFPTGKVYDKNGRSVQGGMAMEVIKRAQLDGSDFQYSPTGTFGFYGENPDGSTNPEDFTPFGGLDIGDLTTPDPLVNLGQGTKNLINTVTDTVAPSIPDIVDGTADITNVDNTLTSFNPPRPSTDAVNLMKINQPEVPDELMIGAFGDIVRPDELQMPEFNNTPRPPFLPSGSGDMPDELMVPFDNTPTKGKGGDDGGDGAGGGGDAGTGGTKGGSALGALESEIADMLKQNEEDRDKDKYLALAKMGLALMSSSQPTLGGALGEAGIAGLDDLQASRKSYRDDKLALLDTRRKLEQARATAAAKDKSGLTGTNVVSSLNNIRNQKAKAMSDLAAIAPQFEGGTLTKEQEAAAEMFRRQIANLSVMESTYEAMLGGIGSLGSTGTFNATAN